MIRSTFYGFTTALSGLKASQTSMDVIGQNVSNANTDGYTRQRADQVSVVSSTTAERYGSKTGTITGQGTSITSLSQIRDTTLDARFRTENPSVGRYDAELNAMSDIEAIFDEATTSGMRDSILALQTAFQNLSLNTGSSEFDSLTRASAASMTKLLNQYAQQLEDAYDQEVYDFENGSVADCNSLLKNLAEINNTITKAEVAGDNPLELYDQRNTMLDQLSSYMDITYSYEKKQLAANIVTNTLHVSMKTENGQSLELIDGGSFAQLGVELDQGQDETTIVDNRMVLKLSGLSDDIDDTYDDIVKKMETDRVPKQPVDITPVYGSTAKYDNGGNVIGYSKNYNANAITNGVLFGTLNMLNSAGDYEIGGSTVRGYKYYMNALDTLAVTMADQMNEQNKSTRYTTSGETLYNVSYLNDTTGERTSVYYKGKEVAAKIRTDVDCNVVKDANGNEVIEYGYITPDEGGDNYTFAAYEDSKAITAIKAMMAENSNKMYISGKKSTTELFALKDADGKEVTYSYTDTDGSSKSCNIAVQVSGDDVKYGYWAGTTGGICNFVEFTDSDTVAKLQEAVNSNSNHLEILDNGEAYEKSIIKEIRDSDGNLMKTSKGETVYARYAINDDGSVNTDAYTWGTVNKTLNESEFEFTDLSEGESKYVQASIGYQKYTPDGRELYPVEVSSTNKAGETVKSNAVYQNKQVYAMEKLKEDGTGTGEYIYGYLDDVGVEPFYNFNAIPESSQGDYKKANVSLNKIPNYDSNVVSEDAGEYRHANDYHPESTKTLNQYWDENLLTDSDGVSTKGITAKYMAVSDAWMQGKVNVTSTRAFSSTGDDNSGDNSNILKFIQLFDNPTVFNTGEGKGKSNITIFTGGYEEFLSSIGDTVALDVSTEMTTYDSYKNVLSSIDNDRLSISGVSIDEEAVDIYQYQRAYEAASRVMTALDELLDRLINNTGRAGL